MSEYSVNLADFGAIEGDNPSNGQANYDAMMLALSVISKGASSGVLSSESKRLEINAGTYHFSKSIPLRHAVWIEGAGNGVLGLRSTVLKLPANKHGFIALSQEIDWDEDTESFFLASRNSRAQGSLLQGMAIESATNGPGPGDGIHVRSTVNVRDVYVSGFGGDGIHSFTNGVNNNSVDVNGNNNSFYYENVLCQFNQNGIQVRGSDSNAGLGVRVDCRHNREWGILDWSFLGNTWVAPHTNGNGRKYNIVDIVNDGSDVLVTTDADHGLSSGDLATVSGFTGAPGLEYGEYEVAEVTTSTQFRISNQSVSWAPYAGGGVVGYGGPYATRNINAHSCFIGAYSEGNQGPSSFNFSTFMFGGLNAAGVINGFYKEPGGEFTSPLSVQEPHSDVRVSIGHTKQYQAALRMIGPGQGLFGTQLKWFSQGQDGGSWHFIDGNGNNRILGFTTESSGLKFGRANPVVGAPFAGGMWLGGPNNDARCFTNGVSEPSFGEWAKGDLIFNRNPTPGGYAGWICTKGGEAGVDAEFKPFGKIEQ